MKYDDYTGSDVEYETKEEKGKFKLTRGKLILFGIILLIIFIIVIIIIVNNNKKTNKQNNKYKKEDFVKLEQRMKEEAPIYVSQKNIELSEEQYRIELKDLLLKNGGSIDSSKLKATEICDGYVLAYKKDTDIYEPYLSCDKLYKTKGYEKKEAKKTTTKKIVDKEKPVILLVGDKKIYVEQGNSYIEPGFTATDNMDGDITSNVKITGSVDTNKSGKYTLVYSVSDSSKNKFQISREVEVTEKKVEPTITTKYNLTTKYQTTTTKKVTTNNTTTKKQTTTKRITTPPVITLSGKTVMSMKQGTTYKEEGFKAVDALGNDITSKVNISGSININVPGTYVLTYKVTDNYGNYASTNRTIIIEDNGLNSITSISITPNDKYVKKGETATLTVRFTPSNTTSDRTIKWSSSNPSVATVSNGVVTAISSGRTEITATTINGKKATAIIRVTSN